MARYRFLTTWLVDSPSEQVWEAIADFERWPSWWTSVQRVQALEPGVYATVWRSALPYELGFEMRVTRMEDARLIEGTTAGELSGSGLCRVSERGSRTVVTYDWNVSTARVWMNALGPIARPLFAWNHDRVMQAGGEGLARLLDTEVTT